MVWAPDPFRIPDRRLTDHFPWIHGEHNGTEYVWHPVPRYSRNSTDLERMITLMADRGFAFRLKRPGQADEDNAGIPMYLAVFIASPMDWTLPDAAFSGAASPADATVFAAARALKNIDSPA